MQMKIYKTNIQLIIYIKIKIKTIDSKIRIYQTYKENYGKMFSYQKDEESRFVDL